MRFVLHQEQALWCFRLPTFRRLFLHSTLMRVWGCMEVSISLSFSKIYRRSRGDLFFCFLRVVPEAMLSISYSSFRPSAIYTRICRPGKGVLYRIAQPWYAARRSVSPKCIRRWIVGATALHQVGCPEGYPTSAFNYAFTGTCTGIFPS